MFSVKWKRKRFSLIGAFLFHNWENNTNSSLHVLSFCPWWKRSLEENLTLQDGNLQPQKKRKKEEGKNNTKMLATTTTRQNINKCRDVNEVSEVQWTYLWDRGAELLLLCVLHICSWKSQTDRLKFHFGAESLGSLIFLERHHNLGVNRYFILSVFLQ